MIAPPWFKSLVGYSGLVWILPKLARFKVGDVFVATHTSMKHYSASLVLKDTYTPDTGTWFGMDFSPAGDLFVAHFSADPPPFSTGPTVNRLSRLDGSTQGTFGSYLGQGPETIVFDNAGNAYVGSTFADAYMEVRKFNSAGTLLAVFSPLLVDFVGEIHIDLAADQKTLFYTSPGRTIFRLDVSANTQLANFATLAEGNQLSELRILPDGGVLVAEDDKILRLDPAGNVVQAYNAPGESNWFSLTLDVDGTSFWSGGNPGFTAYKFDIASRVVLASVAANTDPDLGITGLAVFGGGEQQLLRWPRALALAGIGLLGAGVLGAALRRRMRARRKRE